MDRWNRKVQNIRRRELREPNLSEFVQFVEEKTLLINLFLWKALHEYAGLKEKAGNANHKKLKNFSTKSEEKPTQNQSLVNPRHTIDRGVLTPLLYGDPLLCLPPFFQILSNPLPLVSVAESVITPHLVCYFS